MASSTVLCRKSDLGRASFPNLSCIPFGMTECLWHEDKKLKCELYLVNHSTILDSLQSASSRSTMVITSDPKDAKAVVVMKTVNDTMTTKVRRVKM